MKKKLNIDDQPFHQYLGIAAGNLCYMKWFNLVFLVVVCKSRNGMHFKLLKSDNICSVYTNLNIEKYAVVLAGKPIITDIWKNRTSFVS